jgi:hypothetical protein
LHSVAAVAGRVLGWDAKRIELEITMVGANLEAANLMRLGEGTTA